MNELTSHLARSWAAWALAASWQLALLVLLVALVALCGRRFSARFRYALWLLVLLKIFTPPSLEFAWGVGQWALRPLWERAQGTLPGWLPVSRPTPATETSDAYTVSQRTQAIKKVQNSQPGTAVPQNKTPQDTTPQDRAGNRARPVSGTLHAWTIGQGLMLLWLTGLVGFLGLFVYRYRRLLGALRLARPVDEGPLRVMLERLALGLGRGSPPQLLLSDQVTSPFLFGILRPRIVLPAQLPDALTPEQMANVLLHELIHWARRDLLVGWLQMPAQALFWFHPLVWLANAQLRHERECACDEAALASGQAEPGRYGESLLRVLLAARGRSAVTMGFLGIFERNTRLQKRLEEIMNQENNPRRLGVSGWLFITLFVALFFPMAATTHSADADKNAADETYLVVFKPKPPFNPRTARELLDPFNARHPAGVRSHHFRTEMQDDILIGSICVDGKTGRDAVVKMLGQSDKLTLVEANKLTVTGFERHMAKGQPAVEAANPATPNPTPVQSEGKYSDEEIAGTDARVFFERIGNPKPGYHAFSSLWALEKKGTGGNEAARAEILDLAAKIITNPSETPFRRWQCCYVLSGMGDPKGIPVLFQALSADPDPTVRGCAACALGHFTAPEITQGLKDASAKEKDANVRGWIDKALAGEFRQDPNRKTSCGAWFLAGSRPQAYEILSDPDDPQGKTGCTIHSIKPVADGFGTIMCQIPAEPYRGKRVRMSAKLQAQDVANWAGMWMRVDSAAGQPLAFDNMQKRAVKGTTEKKDYSIVLEVPAESEKIAYGLLLTGTGRASIGNVTFEPVAKDVPTTSMEEPNRKTPNRKTTLGTWFLAGSRPQAYEIQSDADDPQGKTGCAIRSIEPAINGFGTIMCEIPAEPYRGKRVRMSAKLQAQDVANWAGMWMRVDSAAGKPLTFDNMQKRPLKGTSEKKEVSIVLEVPVESEKIAYGLLLTGTGRAWIGKVTFEPVAQDVPTTDMMKEKPETNSAKPAPSGPPRLIHTTPAIGATDVDPDFSEITVTFDRDMDIGGYSWTGGGPEYPPSRTGASSYWRDKRTCVKPVQLEKGHYYRIGINSDSYQNFRGADGVPVDPAAIYFTTRGAGADVLAQTQKPEIVTMEPANGATGVSPGLTELRVTFNVPMGGGFSWCGGGPNYPTVPKGQRARWSADHKTSILPVALAPDHEYRLGLNSRSFKNFQSAGGVPLDPVVYTFTTGH